MKLRPNRRLLKAQVNLLAPVASIAAGLWADPLSAQTNRTWANPISDNFAVATRWNPNGKPTGTDAAHFTQAGAYTIGFTVNESFGALSVTGGDVDWNSASLRTVAVNSVNVLNSSTTLELLGTIAMNCSGVTTVNAPGGGLIVDGGRLTTAALQVSQGSLQIIDAASTVDVTGASNIGGQGLFGSMVVSNGASAIFGNTLNFAPGGSGTFSTGSLTFSSGATGTMDGNINVGTTSDDNRQGIVTITGANTVVTQQANFAITLGRTLVGAPSGDETSRIQVSAGGVFNSGGGGITIQNFGKIDAASGGTFNANGTVTVQSGGLITLTGGTHNANAPTIVQLGGNIAGSAGGVFNANDNVTVQGAINASAGRININSGAALTVAAGGEFTTGWTVVDDGTLTATAGPLNLVSGTGLILQNTAFANLGDFTLNSGARIVVNNGTELRLTSLDAQGGEVDFFGGTVLFTQPTTFTGARIDALLGDAAALRGGRTLHVQGVASLLSQLVLDGGVFTTSGLSGGNLLDLQRGTFNLSSGSLVIGAAGQFGPTLSIGPNVTINAGQTLVNAGASLVMTGGQLSSAVSNSGVVSLESPSATITGTSFNNLGVLRGTGVIASPFTNSSVGEVRAESGTWLKFTGASAANSGRFTLLDGTVEFTQPYSNSSSGQIIGRGNVRVGGTGLTNLGQLIFSNGSSSVFGDVNNNTGTIARGITVTGNGGVTFWDDVTHTANSLFKVQAGSSATFFGTFGGAGAISGGGDVYFEADLTPGASPAIVQYDANVHFGPDAVSIIELGGATPGAQFDRVEISGDAFLNGTIDLQLFNGYVPAYLQQHEVMTAGAIVGRFETVSGLILAANRYLAVTYDADSVLVTAALPGDANLDGTVDIGDFAILASQFNTPGPWAEANFDGNALTDIGDFALLATNFNISVPSDAPRSTVPEPAAGAIAFAIGCASSRQLQRRMKGR